MKYLLRPKDSEPQPLNNWLQQSVTVKKYYSTEEEQQFGYSIAKYQNTLLVIQSTTEPRMTAKCEPAICQDEYYLTVSDPS
ncbi:unnamed protein product [Heterobilharzia americana]|nr:unnamed protein product [Heterobilharzia americana]